MYLPSPNKRYKAYGYDPTHDLVEGALEVLSPPTLDGSEEDTTPKDVTYIGSYNWVEAPEPTIIVPGQSVPLAIRVKLCLCCRESPNMGRENNAHASPG